MESSSVKMTYTNVTTSDVTDDVTDDVYEYDWCWECYYAHWEHKAYLQMVTYLPPVMILVGTVCNILNLVVLHGNHYRYSPSSVALRALALADIAVLNVGLLRMWILVSNI